MRTKDRDQFNTYLKQEYAQYIRNEAVARNMSSGQVVETMVDLYAMNDLMKTATRLSQRYLGYPLTDQQKSQLAHLKRTIERVLLDNK